MQALRRETGAGTLENLTSSSGRCILTSTVFLPLSCCRAATASQRVVLGGRQVGKDLRDGAALDDLQGLQDVGDPPGSGALGSLLVVGDPRMGRLAGLTWPANAGRASPLPATLD